jgi:hypothetical protein
MANLAVAKKKAETADAQQNTGGLLTRKVNAAAKSLLTNKVNPNQAWQVIANVDKSYSISSEYDNGNVQEVLERALGFAVIVDDDGSVPAVFFGGNIAEYTVKLDDFHGFVRSKGIRCDGSTPLAESLMAVAKQTGNGDLFEGGGGFFRRRPSAPTVKKMATPAFVIIITDGAPDNQEAAVDAVQRLSYRGVFLKFLYVGHDRRGWEFLEKLDDEIPVGVSYEQGGRLVDNVDSKRMDSLSGMSDEQFYAAMLDEVTGWLEVAKAKNLI